MLGASEGCWALVRSPPVSAAGDLATARAHDNFDHVAWSAHALGAAIGVPLAFLVFTGKFLEGVIVFTSESACMAVEGP